MIKNEPAHDENQYHVFCVDTSYQIINKNDHVNLQKTNGLVSHDLFQLKDALNKNSFKNAAAQNQYIIELLFLFINNFINTKDSEKILLNLGKNEILYKTVLRSSQVYVLKQTITELLNKEITLGQISDLRTFFRLNKFSEIAHVIEEELAPLEKSIKTINKRMELASIALKIATLIDKFDEYKEFKLKEWLRLELTRKLLGEIQNYLEEKLNSINAQNLLLETINSLSHPDVKFFIYQPTKTTALQFHQDSIDAYRQNNYKKASFNVNLAIEIFEKNSESKEELANCYSTLSSCIRETKDVKGEYDYKCAIQNCIKAYKTTAKESTRLDVLKKLATCLPSKVEYAAWFYQEAENLYQNKYYEIALKLFEKAAGLSDKFQTKDYKDCLVQYNSFLKSNEQKKSF